MQTTGIARFKVILLTLVGSVVLLGLAAGITVWQVVDWGGDPESQTISSVDPVYEVPPSNSVLGIYQNAAVSTDAPHCSQFGIDMFKKGGSVADAAIASLLCVGVVQSQSMGLGGGFLLVLYNASTGTSETLNARDRAPAAAHRDMFNGSADASSVGPFSVAVPGELKGYWELWKKSGNLTWKELFEPTIELAEKGFEVTSHAANAILSYETTILNDPDLRKIFSNGTHVYKEGNIMTRPDLAATLKKISEYEDGGDILYTQTDFMKQFVKDLRDRNGTITEEDMLNYNVTWDDPIIMDIAGNFTLHSSPLPGSGVLIAFFMKLLSDYQLKPNNIISYQRIVEAFKHGYAKRTLLGDPFDPEISDEVLELQKNLTTADYINHIRQMIFDDRTNNTHEYYGAEFYQPEDHGTSHLSILAPNGDAIAVTSTINLYFGSKIISKSTGILYNDMMDDFSAPGVTNAFGVPPSKNNFIVPGKRPMSSMSPSIFTDENGRARLIVGAAGGTKITTAVTMVAIRNLWFGEDIKKAIDARRLHHQLYPMELQYEVDFDPRVVNGLIRLGHEIDEFDVGTSVVQAIAVDSSGKIFANADFRKNGIVAGY